MSRKGWPLHVRGGQNIEVAITAPPPAEIDEALDAAFAVVAESWKGNTRSTLLFDKTIGNFFRDFARDVSADGNLRIGGVDAAMQIALEFKNASWVFQDRVRRAVLPRLPGNHSGRGDGSSRRRGNR